MKDCPKSFITDCQGFLVIATASLCLSLLINQFRDEPLSLIYATKQQRIDHSVNDLSEGQPLGQSPSQVIDLFEMRSNFEEGKDLILDARPEIFYRLGHIPRAVGVSRENFEKDYTKNRTTLEQSKNKPVVVYCSDASCEDSQMVANSLVKLGFSQVLVFKGGWDEWENAKLPKEIE